MSLEEPRLAVETRRGHDLRNKDRDSSPGRRISPDLGGAVVPHGGGTHLLGPVAEVVE